MKRNFEYIIKEIGSTSFSKPPRVLVTANKRVNHVIKNLQAQNTIKQTSFLRFMFIANS